MKKLISILIVLVMAMGMTAIPAMAASDEVSVYLFGEKLEFDVPAQIINGRTLVPMRKIFESLGYSVYWDNDTRTAIATSTERTIRITIDSYTMYVNEETKALDVPACIIDGRTLVPARAISEASGYKVDWDNDTRSVLITDDSSVAPEEPATTSVFDSMAETIMQYGEYDPEDGEYIMFGYDDIGYIYTPADKQIAIIYMYTAEEGVQMAVIVGFYEEYVSDSYITVEFSDGTSVWLMADYDGEGYTMGEPYGEYAQEIEADLIGLMLEAMENEIEPDLYMNFGLTIEDLDMSLD